MSYCIQITRFCLENKAMIVSNGKIFFCLYRVTKKEKRITLGEHVIVRCVITCRAQIL